MAAPNSVEYFFDPACPWTWMTSRWLVDAAAQTRTHIQWRNLSLSVVNAGREIPERYRAAMSSARGAHRIIAALLADDRNDLVGDFYTEWGRRFHHDGAEPTAALGSEVAIAVGAEKWADAADDESWDAVIETSTREGQELAGGSDVGSPVIACGEPRRGIFGPIVSPPPSGRDAVDLFEHVTAMAAMANFFELKRGRHSGPEFGPRP
jgi:hypothetical protein